VLKKTNIFKNDPLWYKDAVIYQLHVKCFHDSNDDGIGDFKGLTKKLDYIKSLGITAIWLLPFYPSPLKDDGYDISNYYDINPQYGTLRDFKDFLIKSHERGIRVITELVINHTSDQHPWFKRARTSEPGSKWRDFYVWSDSSDKYKDARIIFKDFELSNWTWDPVAKAHYWHRFYHHQPDLNFDSPDVQNEIFKVADFWFDLGVDGMRLDAIPYLFEREGTNCENLPETYEYLKKLRADIDQKHKDKMFLAEANQWPEDAIKYLGKGDECQMAFHFPLMPRMYMALQMEDRFPIIDILEQTPPIPDSCQWAIFLRNHDELTLEMVTDEERDYMYRVYTKDPRAKVNLGIRRRLIPLLHNDRKKIELMNILLLSLLGTPIIYYGDEIGMGDNYFLGDRNGVRTPMQWSPDRNAGFSRSNPQQLYSPVIIDPEYHFESVNVETQDKNLSSLLWWMRRVINMRKKFKAFGRGTVEFLLPGNPKVLSFIRQYEDEVILVVINLSRFSQYVELDLSKYRGFTPKEVFSQNEFPTIRKSTYGLTLGPHNHFWMQLTKKKRYASVRKEFKTPELNLNHSWKEIFEEKNISMLEEKVLPPYLMQCRWYRDKSRNIKSIKILEQFSLPGIPTDNCLVIFHIGYTDGGESVYLLPLSFIKQETGNGITKDHPHSVIAFLNFNDLKGILYDGVYDQGFQKNLLSLILHKKKLKASNGEIIGIPSRLVKDYIDPNKEEPTPQVLKAEQSNTSILYGNKLFLKLYRRLETGVNPDAEIIQHLTEKRSFHYSPPFAGAIEYRRNGSEPMALCLLQNCVANQGDAWTFTLDQLKSYYDHILANKDKIGTVPREPLSFLNDVSDEIPESLRNLFDGFYQEMITLLAQRTGELHLALARETENPDFGSEPFSMLYQRSLYQSMSATVRKVWDAFAKNVHKLPEGIQEEANTIVGKENRIIEQLNSITQKKISTLKIRTHGDYHLGQVLFTGKDFMIIDFEGEPARPLSERRLKRSPLRDVAGMIRSFHYAAYGALLLNPNLSPESIELLKPWADLWYNYISNVFLQSYKQCLGTSDLIPHENDEFKTLLHVFMLEKAVYELGYELNNRPEWMIIPIRGIQQALGIFPDQKGQSDVQTKRESI